MRRNFKWARGSPQAKEVRRLEKEFYSNVNAVSDEAMEAKRRTKENKTMKTIKNLEDCKDHGGPLTDKDIDRIDKLTNEQIMLEAKYLKKPLLLTSVLNVKMVKSLFILQSKKLSNKFGTSSSLPHRLMVH